MQSAKSDEGILLVVSGPSGAGKGTICNAIRKIYPDLHYSISMTTRAPRPGEIEGVSYFFRTNEQFEKLIKEDAFLEYACVYDHYYGTPQPDCMAEALIRKMSYKSGFQRLLMNCPWLINMTIW